MLSPDQYTLFQQTGHVTVPDLLSSEDVTLALDDIASWSAEFLAHMSDSQREWFLEQKGQTATPLLRKLDNPVSHRPVFQELACRADILSIVEQLIGPSVSVFFSQIFMKPPEQGGPKPVHQDNFYFGPDDLDATLTVWIALDSATIENGCLYYGDGSHRHGVLEHFAPEGEPFNLQVPAEMMRKFEMTPAPVPAGGISFHHGNTLHQSSANTSSLPRRAAAFHYLRNDSRLVRPALEYDESVDVRIS